VITRRGFGGSLLKKASRLGRLVASMRAAVSVPVTVKLRTGWSEDKENVSELARICEEAGAAAITIHARSREQRYSKAADWELIGRVAAERAVPVVGNGDILTHFEAKDRMERSGVRQVMLARGALIKPWLFREIREGRSWLPSSSERFTLLWRFAELLREHFHDTEKGRRRALRFLTWHMDFFCRYRPLPESEFAERAKEHPLIQTRLPAGDGLPPLEALLRDTRKDTHERLSRELIESATRDEAQEKAERLAASLPPPTEEIEQRIPASEIAG
jgi:tRNA-dihydrouridine synthase 3